MVDAEDSRVRYEKDLTVAMHTVKGTDGELIFYYRRMSNGRAILEICTYPTGRPSSGIVLEGAAAFELCSIARAYCESARLAIRPGQMPVDPPRKPMGWRDALWIAWNALWHREACGHMIMDYDAARDAAIRARAGVGEYTPSSPKRTDP